jgi:glutamate carboxypeptidase
MALARPEVGTTVTPTMASAGSADNVVPESAWLVADVRVWTAEEAARLERSFAGLVPTVPEVRLSVTGGMNRGPLERKASEGLYERLTALGYDVGAAEVGGASDGNFTAALGVPTLDGLGPVGGGAHARDEHLLIDELPGRAEMVTRLLADLHGDG